MERLTDRGYKGRTFMKEPVENEEERTVAIIDRLAAYEDTGMEPEEAFAAIDSAAKLIATMRNNKKAALWLKKYGQAEAGDTP